MESLYFRAHSLIHSFSMCFTEHGVPGTVPGVGDTPGKRQHSNSAGASILIIERDIESQVVIRTMRKKIKQSLRVTGQLSWGQWALEGVIFECGLWTREWGHHSSPRGHMRKHPWQGHT